MVSWHATKDEAESLRREIEASGYQIQGIRKVDVPTDKQRLLEWLNANFRREHG